MSPTGYVALATLTITTMAGLITQLIGMKRADKAASQAATMFRLESEQRRLDSVAARENIEEQAKLVAAKALEAASMVARRVETNKQELKTEVAATQKELKTEMAANTTLTKQGTEAAKNAYHEANQVNTWRAEVNEDIRKIGNTVESLAKSVESLCRDMQQKT